MQDVIPSFPVKMFCSKCPGSDAGGAFEFQPCTHVTIWLMKFSLSMPSFIRNKKHLAAANYSF
jgi:hypothetical protein